MMGVRQRVAGRWLAFLTTAGVTCAASVAARAEEAPSVPEQATSAWLSWTPPPECPGPGFVLDRVRGWHDGPLPVGLEASGEVTWQGQEWEIHVIILVDGARGERRVRVATCGDAAEFLAVAIVLAVDPGRAAELQPPSGEVTSAATTPSVAAVAAQEESDPGPATPASSASSATAAAPSSREAPPYSPKRRKLERSWFVGVLGEGAVGPLPSFQAGPVVEGGFRRGALEVTVGASVLPPVKQTPEGAVADIEYGLATGRLGACALARAGAFELGPCAQLNVGALWTRQPEPGGVSQTVPWVELQAGALAQTSGPRWAAVLGGRLAVPLTQPEFVVSDGTLVHQPTVGVTVDLGVRFFFARR